MPIRKLTIPTAIAIVLLSGAMPPLACGMSVSEAEAQAESAKIAYDEAIAAYEDILEQQQSTSALIEELSARISSEQDSTSHAVKMLYMNKSTQLSELLDIFLSGDNLMTILGQLESFTSIYQHHEAILTQTVKDKAELQTQEAQLAETLNDAEAKKEEIASTLDDALTAYEVAKAASTNDSSNLSYSENSVVSPGVIGDVPSEVTVTVDQLMFSGVIYANGFRYTYYSERVLPGPGLVIPGRHHDSGMVCDEEGYVCVASSDLPKGTVVPTPLGRAGKVYDSGCASGTIDLYLV